MTVDERMRFRDALADAQVEALTAYGEARGEVVLGIVAVISVIRNRARLKKIRSSYAALQTAAFSCWLDLPDADNQLLVTLAHQLVAGQPTSNDPVLDVCMFLASRQDLADPTGGATHYLNPAVVTHTPTWTNPPSVKTVTIGHHTFYTHVAF